MRDHKLKTVFSKACLTFHSLLKELGGVAGKVSPFTTSYSEESPLCFFADSGAFASCHSIQTP